MRGRLYPASSSSSCCVCFARVEFGIAILRDVSLAVSCVDDDGQHAHQINCNLLAGWLIVALVCATQNTPTVGRVLLCWLTLKVLLLLLLVKHFLARLVVSLNHY